MIRFNGFRALLSAVSCIAVLFNPGYALFASELESEISSSSEFDDDYFRNKAWTELSPVHGIIPGYERKSDRVEILDFDPTDRSRLLTITRSSSIERIWLWDIKQEQSFLVHEAKVVISGIRRVFFAPWDSEKIIIFRDYSVGEVSLSEALLSEDLSDSAAINVTTRKIKQIISHRSSQSLIYTTEVGQIYVLNQDVLESSETELTQGLSFFHEDLQKIYIEASDTERLWSYSENSIKVWNIARNSLDTEIEANVSMLSQIALPPILNSKDLDTVYVISDIGRLLSYSLTDGQLKNNKLIEPHCGRRPDNWVLSPDGEGLIILCDRDTIQRYSLRNFELEANSFIDAAGVEGHLQLADELVIVRYSDVSELVLFDSELLQPVWLVSEFCDQVAFEAAHCHPALSERDFRYFYQHPDEPLKAVSSDGSGLLIWDFMRQNVILRPSRLISDIDASSDFTMSPYDPNLLIKATPSILEYWDFFSGAEMLKQAENVDVE